MKLFPKLGTFDENLRAFALGWLIACISILSQGCVYASFEDGAARGFGFGKVEMDDNSIDTRLFSINLETVEVGK